jgi:hypothetical protein
MKRSEENAAKYDAALLEQLYDAQPHTVDMLPHTDEEGILVDNYNATKGTNFSAREIYVALMNLRKKSALHPKGRKKANASAVN